MSALSTSLYGVWTHFAKLETALSLTTLVKKKDLELVCPPPPFTKPEPYWINFTKCPQAMVTFNQGRFECSTFSSKFLHNMGKWRCCSRGATTKVESDLLLLNFTLYFTFSLIHIKIRLNWALPPQDKGMPFFHLSQILLLTACCSATCSLKVSGNIHHIYGHQWKHCTQRLF